MKPQTQDILFKEVRLVQYSKYLLRLTNYTCTVIDLTITAMYSYDKETNCKISCSERSTPLLCTELW